MQLSNPNYALIVIGLVAIIVEILIGVATGFDLLLVGIIFILSGMLGLAVSNFTVAIISVAALSILYVVFGRTFIKRQLNINTHFTNTDRLVGQKAVVVKKITPKSAGQVKIDGEVWRATASDTIEEGKTVQVLSVSGVTLQVSL